jgi:hypothetical protein
MPYYRIAELPLEKRTPFRHASSAEASFTSESDLPTSPLHGNTTPSSPRPSSQSSKSDRREASSFFSAAPSPGVSYIATRPFVMCATTSVCLTSGSAESYLSGIEPGGRGNIVAESLCATLVATLALRCLDVEGEGVSVHQLENSDGLAFMLPVTAVVAGRDAEICARKSLDARTRLRLCKRMVSLLVEQG